MGDEVNGKISEDPKFGEIFFWTCGVDCKRDFVPSALCCKRARVLQCIAVYCSVMQSVAVC